MPKETELTREGFRSSDRSLGKQPLTRPDFIERKEKNQNLHFTNIRRHVVPARISSQSSRHCWRSPLPHTSTLIQRDFGYVLGVHQTKQLSHVAKVDLVKDPESEPARKQFNFGDWRRNFGQCVSRVATHYPFEIWLWPSPEGKEGQLAPTPRRCSAGYLKVSAMRTKEV
ncbi:hypothetical protein TNCV_2322431 [Trichonephila clavipes]|nr:hypothetical protein TNCV_2322431 [Trichonephila clavipes]